MPLLDSITDALRASQKRGAMPTALGTAELRDLGADVLARSVFTAKGTNAIFAGELKNIIDELASGKIGEGQARTALWEVLDALGYDAEKGGFQGEELEPQLKGTLQDLKSFRRRDLIVRTQLALMQGAGEQWRGQQPGELAAFPAWELVRISDAAVPRDWPSRWVIAGGKPGAGMIALKGDPIWGELGSYENFDDALGVDHPPFAFNSGMGWRPVAADEVRRLGITGPDGETPEEFFKSNPQTLAGKLPTLPKPRLSLAGVDSDLVEKFKSETRAVPVPGTAATVDFSDLLARDLAAADKAYGKEGSR